MTKSKQMASGYGQAMMVLSQIQQWLKVHEGRGGRVQYKPFDQLRLLRLRVWSLRYKLTVGEILTLIMPALRGQMHYKKPRYGLGVSVGTVVGDGAHRILLEKINRLYPQGEHKEVWRAKEQELQQIQSTGVLPTIPQYTGSVQKFIQGYIKTVQRRRQEIGQMNHSNKRRYRFSPWID